MTLQKVGWNKSQRRGRVLHSATDKRWFGPASDGAHRSLSIDAPSLLQLETVVAAPAVVDFPVPRNHFLREIYDHTRQQGKRSRPGSFAEASQPRLRCETVTVELVPIVATSSDQRGCRLLSP